MQRNACGKAKSTRFPGAGGVPGTKTGAWKKQQARSGNDQALQIKGSGIGCSARQDGQHHGVELLLAVVKDGLQILTVAPILRKVGVQKNGVRCVTVQHQPGSEGWPQVSGVLERLPCVMEPPRKPTVSSSPAAARRRSCLRRKKLAECVMTRSFAYKLHK